MPPEKRHARGGEKPSCDTPALSSSSPAVADADTPYSRLADEVEAEEAERKKTRRKKAGKDGKLTAFWRNLGWKMAPTASRSLLHAIK